MPPPPGWTHASAADRIGRQRGRHQGDLDAVAARRPGRTRCFSSSPSRRRPRPTRSRSSRPTRMARSSTGPDRSRRTRRRRRSRSRTRSGAAACSALTIVALIVGCSACSPAGLRWSAARGMRGRWREPLAAGASRVVVAAVAVAARRCRAAASAHAYLVKTVPAASGVLEAPPPNIQLTYDEAVEPRLRDHLGDQRRRAPGDDRAGPAARRPIPTRWSSRCGRICPKGWYLIYWRAISVDGHPVAGRVHLRGRTESRTGAAVPRSEHLRDRDHAAAADRAVGDVRVR